MGRGKPGASVATGLLVSFLVYWLVAMRMLVLVVTWRLESQAENSGGTSRTKYQKPSFLTGLRCCRGRAMFLSRSWGFVADNSPSREPMFKKCRKT
jgi:hypothetical protein